VTIEVELGRLGRTPIRRKLGEFTNDQRLNIGTGGFFIVEIGADIANVGIGQANNLTRITGISENFLITGKAGIENDFAATARDSAGSAAVKDAPVFERECGGSMRNFRQVVLRTASFITGLGR